MRVDLPSSGAIRPLAIPGEDWMMRSDLANILGHCTADEVMRIG